LNDRLSQQGQLVYKNESKLSERLSGNIMFIVSAISFKWVFIRPDEIDLVKECKTKQDALNILGDRQEVHNHCIKQQEI